MNNMKVKELLTEQFKGKLVRFYDKTTSNKKCVVEGIVKEIVEGDYTNKQGFRIVFEAGSKDDINEYNEYERSYSLTPHKQIEILNETLS